MSKKDTQSVVVQPNLWAASNPVYGVGGLNGNSVVPGSTISGPTVVTPVGNAVVTPHGNIPINTPTEQLRQDNAGLVDNPPTGNHAFFGTRIGNDVQPKSGGKLGDFFRGLAGKVKPWGGTDASRGDGGTIGYLGSLYTSPAEEAEYRRRSQNKLKLMALADAVRQFGNIYHTTRSAPSQQFDNIYEKERARYLQDKSMRDRDNQYYFQQKAREAQLAMQREKIAEQAARENERLAMQREKHQWEKPIYESRGKEQESKANIAKMKEEYTPTELEGKKKQTEANINRVVAQTEKTRSDAANNARRTNAQIADTFDRMRKRGYSGGSGGSTSGGGWTTRSDGSRWRGQSQKGDVKIQEYKNKDQWIISKEDWKHNYARINEILARNPNSAAAKALGNAKNETERMAIAQRYATSTKESYDYMRALSKGYVPGKKEYATQPAASGGRTVNMNEGRESARNKLKGKSV